ncbi:hypothetical protein ILYODFUR_035603 [Ilyodon furcidens]|uniref:Uncharacterized protein n=1 Tax=Ilyodon furcidens TaxID=33524 RepID=A0ABV0UM79_9TELE
MPDPPQLTPLNVKQQRLCSEILPDGRAPHPISKGVPGLPVEDAHFSPLWPESRSFNHDTKFMAIGEGRNIDRPVNRELCVSAWLSFHHNSSVHRPHYCRGCTDPSVDLPLLLPLTREQDPEILELFHFTQELPSNLKKPSHPFPDENHWPRT